MKKDFSLEDVSDVKIAVSKTNGQKCQRCWKYKEQLIRNEICNVVIMQFHRLKNLQKILIFVFLLIILDLVSKYLVFNYIGLISIY